jgi:hypothetical protein
MTDTIHSVDWQGRFEKSAREQQAREKAAGPKRPVSRVQLAVYLAYEGNDEVYRLSYGSQLGAFAGNNPK